MTMHDLLPMPTREETQEFQTLLYRHSMYFTQLEAILRRESGQEVFDALYQLCSETGYDDDCPEMKQAARIIKTMAESLQKRSMLAWHESKGHDPATYRSLYEDDSEGSAEVIHLGEHIK